jgi:glutamate-1-semialdehyde 2,1-aminomutase
MSAIRLARGFTGRDRIIKFAGNYHGHADSLLVAAGSAAATLGVPNSPGVTAGTAQDTLVLRYNDPQSLEQAFNAHGRTIAAVIFEPIVGNMGCVLPSSAFLDSVARLTRQHGALLICDEVITGFRVAYGGAQSLLGIKPDLTTLGKIVGGGLPVGAYGGRAEIMQHVLPAGRVFQAGTLSGNPLATAAGIATLKLLRDDPPYANLERLSTQLADGLTAAARDAGVPHTLPRCGSMLTLFFNRDAVTDWDSASRSDTKAFSRFFWGMIERGVYLPCSQYEAMFVSAAHTEKDVQETVAAARAALQNLNVGP